MKNATEPTERWFTNYPKNKGSFSEGGFKTLLTSQKIDEVVRFLIGKGAKFISAGKGTNSVYLQFHNTKIRVSDHKKGESNDRYDKDTLQLNFSWDSDIEEFKKDY